MSVTADLTAPDSAPGHKPYWSAFSDTSPLIPLYALINQNGVLKYWLLSRKSYEMPTHSVNRLEEVAVCRNRMVQHRLLEDKHSIIPIKPIVDLPLLWLQWPCERQYDLHIPGSDAFQSADCE
jgi:hypothetical protein